MKKHPTYKRIYLSFTLLLIIATNIQATPLNFDMPIKEIHFIGLNHLTETIIQKQITFRTQTGYKCNPKQLKNDLNQLFLLGTFESINTRTRYIDKHKKKLALEFIVKETPYITTINFDGLLSMHAQHLKSLLKCKPDQLLNLNHLQSDKETILSYLKLQGFDLSKIISIDIINNHELLFKLSEPKIKSVKLKGLKEIPPTIIKRSLYSKPNSIFNSIKARKDRETILKSGYFSEVSHPKLFENGQNISLEYMVKEKKYNVLDTGLEQEEEKLVAFLKNQWNHTLIPSDQLVTKVQVGTEDNQFQVIGYSLLYNQPWFSLPLQTTFKAWSETKRQVLFKDRQSNNLNTHLNKRIGSLLSLSYPFIENKLVTSTKVNVEQINSLDKLTEYSIRSLAYGLSFSDINNRFNPNLGTYANISIERAGNLAGLDVGGLIFTRIQGDSALFIPMFNIGTIALHIFGGYYNPEPRGSNPIPDTFEQEMFDLGGASSLRGYKEFSSVNYNVTTLNCEYRLMITNALQGVLFLDLGKTFKVNWQSSPLNIGYGIGTRLFTPLGPIRIDIGFGDAPMIHFALGQLF